MHGISAAHRTMPLPSYARVTNLQNGRSIIVRVNNRGPYIRDRVVDVSVGAAKALKFYNGGIAQVRVEYIGHAPLEGSDDGMLLATLREGAPAPAPSKVMVAAAKPFIPESAAEAPADRPRTLGRARTLQEPLATGSVPLRREASADAEKPVGGPLGGSALGFMSGRGLY
jgi:rare lipoprotein A